ncbi:hypothetical protein Brsp01_35340 [Brucella sp. NBRC 12950]|nr:hypothetical protein Brsp01_35340 [Brucella sp. NBRC 12950]
MLTAKLAKKLESEGIKVNSVDPDLTPTDMTGTSPCQSPEACACLAVALATIHAFGRSAGFYAYSSSGGLF